MSQYTIGELANHVGITVRTLQYYDHKGLLTAQRLEDSNRRIYNDEHLHQLQLILILKRFGCTLDEIKRLLHDESNLQTLKMILTLHKEELETSINNQKDILNNIEEVQNYISAQSNSPINHLTDIDKVMKQTSTLKSFKSKMWLSASVIGVIQYTSLLVSLLRSSIKPFIAVLPILITYGFTLTGVYFKRISYLCPNCQYVFKPTLKDFVLAKHTSKTRHLSCPKCHEKRYCIEVANK
ncbi:MerR family transcriptional regulator [Staphylococcus devriesei]|uniref:MerR family transcriptional regulator n=1 Tax=Staphylococcus devriesei TaxID=586733 RepID=A0A2K4DQ78_9STAP|nr:MerR family transcriptional regulator [Staphylococcus devriesei]MCE5090247.1 MerR family transcriptional regulator [Staphylococcus devriesei]MCE5096962.1 MerR family transcriptional regulator [Staphylococcus devriesei]PNZ88968.1 MerR family transcriptional regulator [Staphylococcus devriesei]PTE73729.1 MerR family transcriptional regulator [Staphylococcus devriesei]PTF04820.1 MerR family transcriptional regulator [Staphylococcus devriesei]